MVSTGGGSGRPSGRVRGGALEVRKSRRLRRLLVLFVLLQPLALLAWKLFLRKNPRLAGAADVTATSAAAAHDISSVFRRYQAFAHQQLHQAGTALQAHRGRVATDRANSSGHSSSHIHSLRPQDLASQDKAIRGTHFTARRNPYRLHTGRASSTGGADLGAGGALINLGVNVQVSGVHQGLHREHTVQQQHPQPQGKTPSVLPKLGARLRSAQSRLRVKVLEAASEQQCLARLQEAGEEWERAVHRRDFGRFPVRVQGSTREVGEWEGCDVPCHFVSRTKPRPKPQVTTSASAPTSSSANALGAQHGIAGGKPSAALGESKTSLPGAAVSDVRDPSPEDWVDGFFGFTRQVRRGDGTLQSLQNSDAFPLPRVVSLQDRQAHNEFWPARVHRSMEPAAYYATNNVTKARAHGVTVSATLRQHGRHPTYTLVSAQSQMRADCWPGLLATLLESGTVHRFSPPYPPLSLAQDCCSSPSCALCSAHILMTVHPILDMQLYHWADRGASSE